MTPEIKRLRAETDRYVAIDAKALDCDPEEDALAHALAAERAHADAEIATLRARAEQAERRLETREDQLAEIAGALGCEEEWTSAHDHGLPGCWAERIAHIQGRAEQAERERDEARAEVERLRGALEEAVARCDCGGTGRIDLGCRYCGDSTYDHECETRERPCGRCSGIRAALAGEGDAPDPVAAERERCARIAEAHPLHPTTHTGERQRWLRASIAEAIRSGGEASCVCAQGEDIETCFFPIPTYFCTRPAGHEGEHVACGGDDHRLARVIALPDDEKAREA